MLTLQDSPPTAFNAWYVRRGKSLIDRLAGTVLLLLMSPLLITLLMVVRLTLGRHVIFVQPRAGRHERPFSCYKIRTMKPDRRKSVASYSGQERRSLIPSPDDPRHTTIGTFLRRYGLDELPQLFNVLRGDMSLVGPRPEIWAVAGSYDHYERKRFAVKPGLTGYWQVTHRSDGVDLREFAAVDIEYCQKVSLLNDLRILCATPRAVCSMAAATECNRSSA